MHHRLTIDACNAGKHVLVEKPMGISLQQCDEMVEAAPANGVKLLHSHKNGCGGVAVAVGFADGAGLFECQVICGERDVAFQRSTDPAASM